MNRDKDITAFIKGMMNKRKVWMDVVDTICLSLPVEANELSHRFFMSRHIVNCLAFPFDNLEPVHHAPYNMLWNGSVRIQVRRAKQVFQYEKQDGELSRPRGILLKNIQSSRRQLNQRHVIEEYEMQLKNFDVLMVIQPPTGTNNTMVGVITTSKLGRIDFATQIPNRKDKIEVFLNNDDYNVIMESRRVIPVSNQEIQAEQSKIFETRMDNLSADLYRYAEKRLVDFGIKRGKRHVI